MNFRRILASLALVIMLTAQLALADVIIDPTSLSVSTRLFIESVSGRVGIGTNTPNSMLHVIGAVCAEASDTNCAPTAGDVRGTRLCIGTDCRNAWPTSSGGQVLSTLANQITLSGGGGAVTAPYATSAGGAPWAGITGKPAFALNANAGRVRMYEVGCNSAWGTSCDANTNGVVDSADSASSAASVPWTGVTGRPSFYSGTIRRDEFFDHSEARSEGARGPDGRIMCPAGEYVCGLKYDHWNNDLTIEPVCCS